MIGLAFFGFLVGSASIYWLIPRQQIRTVFLSAVSLVFISLNDRWATVVVVALSVYAYGMGKVIGRTQKPVYHRLGVVGLVLVLVVFKYLGLLEETFNGLSRCIQSLPTFHIDYLILPLGISYITFKFISYLTDIHWNIIRPGNLLEVLCYGSLFTIFVAGPIERFERLVPQLHEPASRFSWAHVDGGLQRIAFGMFKKFVVADWIGHFTSPVWRDPGAYNTGMRALALLGYSIQIYLDFAGYSDIAIGGSRFFGLRIMENFDWPYLQPNITQFWRHWHISLSDWIRDYLFFPLSRVSRNKPWNLIVVPLIAMGLCGLWHGAAPNFVAWGLWHGAGIAALQVWNSQKRSHPTLRILAENSISNVIAVAATFAFVTIGWMWFRG